MSKLIKLCLAPNRWNGCKIQKNICCPYCIYYNECLALFKIDSKNKIRPCKTGMDEDCEYVEII